MYKKLHRRAYKLDIYLFFFIALIGIYVGIIVIHLISSVKVNQPLLLTVFIFNLITLACHVYFRNKLVNLLKKDIETIATALGLKLTTKNGHLYTEVLIEKNQNIEQAKRIWRNRFPESIAKIDLIETREMRCFQIIFIF